MISLEGKTGWRICLAVNTSYFFSFHARIIYVEIKELWIELNWSYMIYNVHITFHITCHIKCIHLSQLKLKDKK